MLFLLTDSPQKLKLEKTLGTLIINHLLSKFEFSSTSKTFIFLFRNTKNNHSSASNWWENTKSSFKEDARTFSENIYLFKKKEFKY